MFRTRASLPRLAILWLLAVTIAMGAAIPQGWMPAQAADDRFAVMICAQGMTIAEQEKVAAQLRATFGDALDQDEPDGDEDDGEDPGDRCPYGVAAQAAAIAGPALDIIAAPARTRDLLGSVAESTTGQGLAAPPPPATGPPAAT